MSGPYTGILDCSHWEDAAANLDHMRRAYESGVGFIIAKATQGKDYVDPAYLGFMQFAHLLGMRLGSYHFATASEDGAAQAEFFAATVARLNPYDSRPFLDFEPNPHGPDATVAIARAFVDRTKQLCGVKPVVYCDMSRFALLREPLSDCDFWLASYGNVRPPCYLWQYTDGKYGPADETTYPRVTPGFGPCDRSAYSGTFEQLATEWDDGALFKP